MFSTEERALAFAAEHEKDVVDFGVRFGSITAEARRAYDAYRDARADLLGDGVEVPSFEALVAAAIANLRKEHEDRQRNRMTVCEAVAAFLSYKRPRIGERHAEGLGGNLKRFARDFGSTPLDRLAGSEIESWVCSLRSARVDESGDRPLLGPVTRNKMRKSLKALFSYGLAKGRGWCHQNPMVGIEPERVKTAEPKAYSVAETRRILETALAMESPILPCLVLGFFSGLRPTEAQALDLAVINLAVDEFRTPALHPNGEPTKTGARIAPLTPACKAWLGAQSRREGLAWVGCSQSYSNALRAVLSAAKVKGIHDGIRHSFITYRTAEIRDVARAADECGNSPNIIRKHYREIVTAAAAKEFFAIRP
jgi:integrase